MEIVNFETKHISEAMELARAAYYEERQHVMELPQIDDIPDLYNYAENGLGVAAFDNGKMTGFLCCCEPCTGYDLFELSKEEWQSGTENCVRS